MKAMICPQCGGLIHKIVEGSDIVECSYCTAKIFLGRKEDLAEKPPEISDSLHIPLADYKTFDESETATGVDNSRALVVGIVLLVAAALIIAIVIGVVRSDKKTSQKAASTPLPHWTPSPVSFQAAMPQLTNADAVSMPKPAVPKNFNARGSVTIEVSVGIDEQGSVYEAEAYTGPEQLKKPAIEAARKAKFKPQNQRAAGVLTYEFGPK